MTNTLTTHSNHETIRDSIDFITHTPWERAAQIVDVFHNEPLFIESLTQNGIDPHNKTTVEYANALSIYSQDYIETYGGDSLASDDVLKQITLISNTPYFLHIQKEMSHFEKEKESRWLSKDEIEYMRGFKPYMVWYNQQLSDYMYVHSDGKLSDINRALIEESLSNFPRETNMIEREVKQATRGARTESVARQLLDRTPFEHSAGTAEDDLRGGDLIVIRNGKRIKIDIKSSLSTIAKLRGGYHDIEKKHITYAISRDKRDHDASKHVIVLFPGFADSDLGNSLSLNLSEKDTQSRADFMTKQLTLAFRELRI
jgi:hypothetical protein